MFTSRKLFSVSLHNSASLALVSKILPLTCFVNSETACAADVVPPTILSFSTSLLLFFLAKLFQDNKLSLCFLIAHLNFEGQDRCSVVPTGHVDSKIIVFPSVKNGTILLLLISPLISGCLLQSFSMIGVGTQIINISALVGKLEVTK